MLSMAIMPQATVSADIADGTYKINYEVKESGSDSTSIADGYFSKPATLTVNNGVKHIQLTVTSSDMIKSLNVSGSPVSVVSEGDNTRTVKFKVGGDLSQPVNMEMHIIVPDLYDTTHTARAVFDTSGLATAEASTDKSDNATTDADQTNDEAAGAANGEDNPPTGDSTPIALYAMLLLASGVGIFMVVRTRLARN